MFTNNVFYSTDSAARHLARYFVPICKNLKGTIGSHVELSIQMITNNVLYFCDYLYFYTYFYIFYSERYYLTACTAATVSAKAHPVRFFVPTSKCSHGVFYKKPY